MIKYKDIVIILLAALTAVAILKIYVLDAVAIPSASMETTLIPGDFVLVNKLSYGIGITPSSNRKQASLSFLPEIHRNPVNRGDVVVFRFPESIQKSFFTNNDYFVKRCVAKSGDIVEIDHGQLIINNQSRSHVHRDGEQRKHRTTGQLYPSGSEYTLDEYGPLRVPAPGDILHLTNDTYPVWADLIKREGHSVSWSNKEGCLIDGKPTQFYIVSKRYVFVLGDNFYHSFDSRFWGFLPEEQIIGKATLIYWSLRSSDREDDSSSFLESIRWDRVGVLVR